MLEGPIGPIRDDIRAGIIASIIANVNRDTKKKVKPFSPLDFVPDWEDKGEPQVQTPEQQQGIFRMLAAAMKRRG